MKSLKELSDADLVETAKLELDKFQNDLDNVEHWRSMETIVDECRRRRGVPRPESPTPESKKQVRFKRSRPSADAENWAWDVVSSGNGIPSKALIEAKALAYGVTSGRLRQMCQVALNTQKKAKLTGPVPKFNRPSAKR